mgnify:CR=1 FL=1
MQCNPISTHHRIPNPKTPIEIFFPQPPNQKSVAFLSLAFVITHSGWIPIQCFIVLVVAVEDGVSNEPTTETTKTNPVQAVDDASTTKDESW